MLQFKHSLSDKTDARGQSYQTFFSVKRKIFSVFLPLGLTISLYLHYFVMLQTLKLNNKNHKAKKTYKLWWD